MIQFSNEVHIRRRNLTVVLGKLVPSGQLGVKHTENNRKLSSEKCDTGAYSRRERIRSRVRLSEQTKARRDKAPAHCDTPVGRRVAGAQCPDINEPKGSGRTREKRAEGERERKGERARRGEERTRATRCISSAGLIDACPNDAYRAFTPRRKESERGCAG